jgi:hypothetical protein
MFSYEINVLCDGKGCDALFCEGVHETPDVMKACMDAVADGWELRVRGPSGATIVQVLCPECAKKDREEYRRAG